MVRTPLLVITLSCFLGLGPGPASAEVAWVTLTTERGEQMRALLGRPDSVKGRAPAVIYNHGTEVRMNGYQDGEGNDVGGFVRALVAEGYVVLAPIRTFERTTAYMSKGRPAGSPEAWDAVIQGGLRTVAAARAYLAARSDVDPEKIANDVAQGVEALVALDFVHRAHQLVVGDVAEEALVRAALFPGDFKPHDGHTFRRKMPP